MELLENVHVICLTDVSIRTCPILYVMYCPGKNMRHYHYRLETKNASVFILLLSHMTIAIIIWRYFKGEPTEHSTVKYILDTFDTETDQTRFRAILTD